ncbi:hypothetical protein BV22DRAFT_1144318 [Leucogyrophana mollusca]|uniref:Uncharacterized protein n=1 Tax=Leucogyrophana mollusca TaxID=85980 RepID=A0ACB8BVI8_9AGAM|nr:hypothetical protein BV22DRAFT_1144318 [Leucogyrophana mollusca]
MQRFRQFLAEEEKFWTQLIARYQRSFALDEAGPVLVNLGILTNSEDGTTIIPDPGVADGVQVQNAGRNHFQFPPENSTPSPSTADRETRLAILSKAIVCLGDLARYRELYNESGGRPRAGHEDSTIPARRGARGRRGGVPGFDAIPRARNYDKAIQCYEQARLLVPYEGNPSHQLAILASYQKDTFGSLLHYYRALCVRQPYETASENVKVILIKALEHWKTKDPAPDEADPGHIAPRLRVDAFKEKTVVLHALWRLGSNSSRIDPAAIAQDVQKDFAALVSERILPIDTVSKAIALSEGALWKHLMVRDGSSGRDRGTDRHAEQVPPSAMIESQISSHVIAMHRALLEIGAVELTETPPEDAAENDLAQRITATFRRTLPALRIANKWLLANFKYVMHSSAALDGGRPSYQGVDNKPGSIADIPSFWTQYARFFCALRRAFPADRLPSLTAPLEEDIDMRGFLPLRNLMAGESASRGESAARKGNTSGNSGREKVHPNEEQLMRISDLLRDAKALAAFEVRANSPIVMKGNNFAFRHAELEDDADKPLPRNGRVEPVVLHPTPQAPIQLNNGPATELDEDAMTEATDPVGDAFRQVLDNSVEDMGDDVEDEDQIVWDPRATTSPIGLAISSVLPTSPVLASPPQLKTNLSPIRPIVTSPTRPTPKSPPATPFTGTTAQDLLNNISKPSGDLTRSSLPSSASHQPQPLFGPGHSIWSTSLDNNPSKFNPVGSGALPSHPQPFSSQTLSQSPWSPPFESTQNGPYHLHNPHAAPSFPSHHLSPQHHKSLSLASPPQQYLTNQSLQGPFAHTSPTGQSFGVGRQQPQIQGPYTDPAILSAASASPSLYHQAGYQDFSVPNPQYPRGMPNYTPSSARIWGNGG